MKIAMWSGPRNLSTAMMYAFGNRPDCAIVDEPFYAAYLTATGQDHPMKEAIVASQPNDPDDVIRKLTGPNPGAKAHFYQKHMTQHMIPEFDRSWLEDVTNIFLIRHPARVIASYAAKRQSPTLGDIGFRQQAELYDVVVNAGGTPLVIDSHDIRENPGSMLRHICEVIGLSFDPTMLSWPAGGHEDDGVWARHWYGAVHRSTGFAGAEGPVPELDPGYGKIADAAMVYYERLKAQKL